ncbi:DUF3095 domain-containing protein [Mesorhizobium sp. VNQ89]|uniref:DUF3095 domain-containing protein n=1 Tax=Mesorhizobium quangtriensis TaxID=3157709 RepID=UPI0032B818B7
MSIESENFTRSLPVSAEFSAVLDEESYRRVPDDWLIAVTDVVSSRKAIAAGHYKAVNMAGVGVISALMNALGTQTLPYIFSGDGAAAICAPEDRETVADALARMVAWTRDELGLELRAALIPVADIRAEGYDVLVQAVRVSDAINNFAFHGGGLSRAETLMKAGKYGIAAASAGDRPDLTGLSCRWSPITPPHGKIVSIIAEPDKAAEGRFSDVAQRLLALIGMQMAGAGSPMPKEGPTGTWPPEGLGLEARAMRGEHPLWLRKLGVYFWTLFSWFVIRFEINMGSFNARHYREFTSLNTDYRKFQDGLRVTASLGDSELARLTDFLEGERVAKNLRYGLCVQDSAILTCYVPSVTSDTHFHFLDGAGGGYAGAAENMKS